MTVERSEVEGRGKTPLGTELVPLDEKGTEKSNAMTSENHLKQPFPRNKVRVPLSKIHTSIAQVNSKPRRNINNSNEITIIRLFNLSAFPRALDEE